MRILRALCNIGIFLTAFIVINTIGLLSFNVMSWGVGSVDAVHIVSKDNKNINFWDGYDFMMTDIAVNLDTSPKPYVRNIFGGNGLWADNAINFTAGVIKPALFTQVQLDNLAVSRTSSIYEDLLADYSKGSYRRENLNQSYINNRERLGSLIELSTFNDINANLLGVKTLNKDNNTITIEANTGKVIIAVIENVGDKWEATISYNNETHKYLMFEEKGIDYPTAKITKIFEDSYHQWAIRGNDLLATRYWLSNKYSDIRYDKFVNKFFILDSESETTSILTDSKNQPIIKTEGMILFIVQCLSFIIALIFAIKYPVSIIQARVSSARNKNGKGGVGPSIVL